MGQKIENQGALIARVWQNLYAENACEEARRRQRLAPAEAAAVWADLVERLCDAPLHVLPPEAALPAEIMPLSPDA